MDYSQAWLYQLEKQIGKKNQDVNQSFFKDNTEIEETIHIPPWSTISQMQFVSRRNIWNKTENQYNIDWAWETVCFSFAFP